MSQRTRVESTLLILVVAAITTLVPETRAQMTAPNPYRTVAGVWGQLPEGRTWGATSAVYPALDGVNIWIAERCGQNSCADKDEIDPILLFDPSGRLLKSFGAGLILWPHGMHVDRDGNVWVTDAVGFGAAPEGRGHEILKFSPDGELLMTLGKKGVAGDGPDTFRQPSDILVAPNGDIFVADGHGAGGNNRIVKFSSDGTFIKAWGSTGAENGEFRDPHALAMDSQGRLFVGDRANSRIQIFDQDGNHIATWTQFGAGVGRRRHCRRRRAGRHSGRGCGRGDHGALPVRRGPPGAGPPSRSSWRASVEHRLHDGVENVRLGDDGGDDGSRQHPRRLP